METKKHANHKTKNNKELDQNIKINRTKFNMILSNDYKKLIQKETYEIIILKIMNSSQIVFNEEYEHIDKQSNGESDFVSMPSRELIDAKTIFLEEQCEKLSLDDIKAFLNDIVKESNDIFYSIMNKSGLDINSTILYTQISRALAKSNSNENIIIFIPFPFTLEIEDCIISKLNSDIFSQIMFKMKRENKNYFDNHKVYFIYPNIENKIIIKNVNDGITEYLSSDIIAKYIYTKF